MSVEMIPQSNQITIDDIITYVMHNPENTNPAILRGMLDELSQGGSDSSKLSIAYLTVTNLRYNDYPNSRIKVYGFFDIYGTICHISGGDELSGEPIFINDSETIPIILYQGHAIIKFDYDDSIAPAVITGALRDVDHNAYVIGGDCSFSAYGNVGK